MIEFALVAPVFFFLLFAIIETGTIFLAQSDLQNAVNYSARIVQTGQVKSQNMTSQQFRTAVCNQLRMLHCGSELRINLESYASFSGASYSPPLNADGTPNSNANKFSPGISGQVVMLQASYTWPIATPLLTPFLRNMAGNYHLIVATAAFRNEPF